MNRDTKKYSFNEVTLNFEESKVPFGRKVTRLVLLFAASVLLSSFYYCLYFEYMGPKTPKERILEKENARLGSDLDVVNTMLDGYQERLAVLEERDNLVYRSIFGMEEIPSDVREAGYGGVDRYAHIDACDRDGMLGGTVRRIDRLNKKAYIQSVSFDDVSKLSKRAGDMASCIPAISPVTTDPLVTRFSSSFGYRTDPGTKKVRMHYGVDLSAPKGTSIYATGNGTVVKVGFDFYGYGHYVLVDHGFGYKTRYGHMSKITVSEGQSVRRGTSLGEVGNTGRSFGNHVHYEVIYKGKCVNPLNYFDLKLDPEEYASMVQVSTSSSSGV